MLKLQKILFALLLGIVPFSALAETTAPDMSDSEMMDIEEELRRILEEFNTDDNDADSLDLTVSDEPSEPQAPVAEIPAGEKEIITVASAEEGQPNENIEIEYNEDPSAVFETADPSAVEEVFVTDEIIE